MLFSNFHLDCFFNVNKEQAIGIHEVTFRIFYFIDLILSYNCKLAYIVWHLKHDFNIDYDTNQEFSNIITNGTCEGSINSKSFFPFLFICNDPNLLFNNIFIHCNLRLINHVFHVLSNTWWNTVSSSITEE